MATDLDERQGTQGDAGEQPSNDISQRHYDDEFNQLTSPEHLAKDAPEKPVAAGSLAAAEGAAAPVDDQGEGATTEAGQLRGALDQLGAGFNPLDETTGVKATILAALSGRGKILAGGGGAVALIAIGITMFMGASLEIPHIAKILQGYESRIEQKFEKDAAKNIFRKVINKSLARARAEKAGIANTDAAEVASAKATGEILTESIDTFDLEKFQSALADKGIFTEFDASGNLTSITNESGIDLSKSMSDADFSTIEKAMPEWAVGQMEAYRPLMVDQYGVTFEGLPDTAKDNVKKTLTEEIGKGATETDILAANEEAKPLQDQKPTGQNGATPTTPADVQQGMAATDPLNKAINATNESLLSTGDSTAAIDAGTKAFGVSDLNNSLLVGSLLTTACTVKKDVDLASKARVPQLAMLLIRHGNLLLTLASQLQTGKISGDTVNQVAQMLNGDPGVLPTKSDPRPEASLPFNNSAAWQRATGGIADASTPEISSAVLPSRNSAQKIVDKIDGLMNRVPGANLSCKALTSGWGIAIQGALGVGQLVADIGSFGSAQVAFTGGLVAFQETVTRVILPDILRYFTVAGVSGTENSVQWLNNSDAGLNLSFNDYARRLGAKPLTTKQYGLVAYQAEQSQLAEQQQEPLSTRLFAISNPYSLASRMFFSLPLGSINNISSSIQNYFVNLPRNLAGVLASLVSPHKLFADTPNAANNPYGITQYSFTNNEATQYDSVQNENFLYGTLQVKGNSGNYASASRISLLGNPATYKDNPSGDPNSQDYLHCFVDSYTQLTELADSKQGTSCGTIGELDYVDNPTPSDNSIPNSQILSDFYCKQLFASNPSDMPKDCSQTILPQINDDFNRFRQYILDVHVMGSYESLTNAT